MSKFDTTVTMDEHGGLRCGRCGAAQLAQRRSGRKIGLAAGAGGFVASPIVAVAAGALGAGKLLKCDGCGAVNATTTTPHGTCRVWSPPLHTPNVQVPDSSSPRAWSERPTQRGASPT